MTEALNAKGLEAAIEVACRNDGKDPDACAFGHGSMSGFVCDVTYREAYRNGTAHIVRTYLTATVPAGDGELVERLMTHREQILASRDGFKEVTPLSADLLEAASRLSQGTGVRDAQVLRLTEENEALTQNAESLLEIIDMRKARIKALEEALETVIAAYDDCSGAEPSLSVLHRTIDIDARAALSPNPTGGDDR